MRVEHSITLSGNSYHAQISSITLTPAEQDAATRFGEPVINFGGTITGSATRPGDMAPTSVTIVLPDKERRIPSQLPVKQVFSLDDYETADVMAKVWVEYVRDLAFFAREGLLIRDTAFTGEFVDSREGPAIYTPTTATYTIEAAMDDNPLSGKDAGTIIGEDIEFLAVGTGGSSQYTYEWDILSGPDTDQSQFDDATIDNPIFTPSAAGIYVIEGKVKDPVIDAEPTTFEIEAHVNPVTVDAGAAKTGTATNPVALSDALITHATGYNTGSDTIAWSVVSGPNTSSGQFSSTTTQNPSFTPTQAGTYVLKISVANTIWLTVEDTLTATIS